MPNDNDSQYVDKLKPNKGGRPPGPQNGDRKELFAACKKRNIDIFQELLDDVKTGSEKARSLAIKTAMDFLYTKTKAVEISGDLDINIQQQDLIELKSKVRALRATKS
jgi:hypothetical protein